MENHHVRLVPTAVIYSLDTADFIYRVCSPRGMNKRESKLKVGVDYAESFLKVSLTITDDFCNNFELR